MANAALVRIQTDLSIAEFTQASFRGRKNWRKNWLDCTFSSPVHFVALRNPYSNPIKSFRLPSPGRGFTLAALRKGFAIIAKNPVL
jgi:hypothetical protein